MLFHARRAIPRTTLAFARLCGCLIAVLPGGALVAQTAPANLAPAPANLAPPEMVRAMQPPGFPALDMREVRLGHLLFYDPILSGNENISCAACHHPREGTADGLALGFGEGARGLGGARRIVAGNPPEGRIPRNAPALFNLGAAEFTTMFHDGRVEADPRHPNGLRTPLGADFPAGLRSPLAAQAMFPVTSDDEMAGHHGENPVANAARSGRFTGAGGVWDILAQRVAGEAEYRARFAEIYGADQGISFPDIANVLAAFMAFEWRADDSDFDRLLREGTPLPDPAARRGMALFYGASGCGRCHSGPFQTDHRFHAIAMPQIGPGKAASFENHQRDLGRMLVTGARDDAYAFRTPSLRNVTLSAPYGHAGAYAQLEDVVRHHLDPVGALAAWRPEMLGATLPDFDATDDFQLMQDAGERAAIAAANVVVARRPDDQEIADILAFLAALTDPPAAHLDRLGVPDHLPGGRDPEP